MVDSSQSVEIWGGIECTINRVKDRYMDQLEFSGHYHRDKDIELLAQIGIKRLRYPVLWEKHQLEPGSKINWDISEKNLNRLRELGVDPIVGLVHHGSGPSYASIETDNFASGLAAYAAQVARKFPWVKYYTPVNEPLTTARFCGLYGHWYPHGKSGKVFLNLLINECKATVLAMRAIHEVNPEAQLIQTEDLGRTYSTPLLEYQANFENHRRWLSFDLMIGNVTPKHPLWHYLLSEGVHQESLEFFWENSCTPDILGFNYYPTSERFLDEDLAKYPIHTHGGNGRHKYADVEAVRVDLDEEYGIKRLMREAWERFKLPMAVTEVHLGCTRDEQMRWIKEIYTACNELKSESVDVRAITGWAMLGSYGWNKLLTSEEVSYEPGIFDLSAGKPRPTALAKLLQNLAVGEELTHPVLEEEGWWKKDLRILYFRQNVRQISKENKSSQPLLIIGKTGTLGNAFARLCQLRGIRYELLGREEFDISSPLVIESVIKQKRPWAIVNAAGFVRVDDAETCSGACYVANAYGPAYIARLSQKYHFKFLTFSSDLVFDGLKKDHYDEADYVSPLNVYGRSKAVAERLVMEADPFALIIRTSAFFGPWDNYNFVTGVLNSLQAKSAFAAVKDVFISPTYVPDLVNASLDLMLDEEYGIWHLANAGETTWALFAADVAKRANLDSSLILPMSLNQFKYPARRPKHSVLTSTKGMLLPKLEDALHRYFNEQELIDLSLPKSVTA
ncbi:family 1 glycosylhydrolase [Pedobacter sp. SYSU D00535]|uniref:family 1 glycosylhydrolase n=1 Tax=Pedobacter sp. SYSU D00535 TaxID=2810308 RepID=UPI001A968932|nr:family 1 glycosylhydrolase [Pedobacter sp. SYSU D00535]